MNGRDVMQHTTGDFVEVDWLIAQLDDPRLRIIDARSVPHGGSVAMPSGREQFIAGHLPGAVHLDYADDLSDVSTPYAIRVAPADAFARTMSAAGIGDDAIVVAYDAGTIPFAARMVWMLRFYGHDAAHVLAGGIGAWTASGMPLSTNPPTVTPAHFSVRARPELRASRDEVLAIVEGRAAGTVVETQRNQTYAQRNRDIANAVRISGNDLLDDARGGRVADPAALERLLRDARIDKAGRTVVTCGSGVSASGAWLALRAAGVENVAVYDGSWMEWEHDGLPSVPKTTT